MPVRHSVPVSLLLLVACGPLAGQDLEVPFTVWGLEEGLSQSSIRAMVQDSAGVLWFGTQRGLNRFDGRTFRSFLTGPHRPAGLTDDYVHSLAVAPGGRLWVGTETGLDLFDPDTETARHLTLDGSGSWPPLAPSDTAAELAIGRLVPMADGAVLALARGTDVFLTLLTLEDDGHRASRILDEAGRARDICGTPDGALATVGAGRILRLDGLGRRIEELPTAPDTLMRLVCTDEVLGTTGDGRVLALDETGWREIGRVPGPGAQAVRDIAQVGTSILWLATGQGLYRLDRRTGSVSALPVGGPGQIPHREVYGFLVDRTGVTWVGTWNGLAAAHPLVRATDRALVGRELPGDWGVLSVLPLGGGGVLVGMDSGGLALLGEAASQDTPAALPPELTTAAEDTISVWSLDREEDGTIWIATDERGLLRWPLGGRPEPVHLEGQAGAILTVFVDGAGDVWAAARGLGLMRLDRDDDVFRVVAPSPPDESWYYWSIAPDPDGGFWVAGIFRGLFRVDAAGNVRELERELPSNRILTVTRARDGTLWLGTEGDGLIQVDPDGEVRLWTADDGLPHDNVQRIVEDRAGALWVATNDGVALFDPEEGPVFTLRRRHGLAGNRFFANAGALAGDGRVVLGGQDGLTFIDPEPVRTAVASAQPSSVTLTRLVLMGRDTTLALATRGGGLELDHDQNFVTFEFAASDYTDPALNRYRYRLAPLESEFREAGSTPVATYTSIPPGAYAFEVLAGNSYGRWTPEPALSLPVVIHPAFWQTLWFRALVFAAAVTLIATFFRYRYAQLAARTRLRLDIAGKLHDDIGADLSTIALKTELVRATAPLDDRRKRQLEAASRLARETAHRVRETVWLVNTQYDTLAGLVAKLRDTADVMLAGQVRYDFIEPQTIPDREVGMETRQHVHLLFKETLNNLLKHARARHVRITLEVTPQEIRFQVEDDGLGFDTAAPESGSGQRLMRERARAAHGMVAVDSAPGQGTRVAFRGRLR